MKSTSDKFNTPSSRFKKGLLLFLALWAARGEETFAQQQMESLPAWQQGLLDIHHINTGKGESTFFMLPDGTTLLVDAGEHTRPMDENAAAAKPNAERNPGEWIARYINRLLDQQRKNGIDYVMLTHFDTDHIGGLLPGMQKNESGDYILTGISEVIEHIPTTKIIDRAWPNYDWPKPLLAEHIVNYKDFVEWQAENRGVAIEQFQVGVNDQITLLNNPDEYSNFEIRNIVSNGVVWTGTGTDVISHFPPVETLSGTLPSENASSAGFKLSYGDFDYFTGGDLIGVLREGQPDWLDIETPVAKVLGPVDVQKLNHHGYLDAQNEFFMQTVRPRVLVLLSWDSYHPAKSTLDRLLSTDLYSGPRDIFALNIIDKTREMVGPTINELKSQQGHIVIRVAPGGTTYQIFILDDATEEFSVKSVHGPYESY